MGGRTAGRTARHVDGNTGGRTDGNTVTAGRTDEQTAGGPTGREGERGGGVGWRGGAACLTRGVWLGGALRKTLLLRGLEAEKSCFNRRRHRRSKLQPILDPHSRHHPLPCNSQAMRGEATREDLAFGPRS